MIVRCPKCRQTMKCEPKQGRIQDKSKRCVYCGHTFKIYISPEKDRIVR